MNSVDDVIDDRHLNGTGFIRQDAHPSEGMLRTTGAATQWSRTPTAPQSGAPRLGEHGTEVLRDAGYSEIEILELIEAGITTRPDLS
jgi:crotonobetainyl-CoA:carnitine CoA-transferase CaiB-like acyl-CoA transferase